MFNRLDEYLENNNSICPEQKGFRVIGGNKLRTYRKLKQISKENNIFMQTLIRKVFQIL
jgi:hypothetical protein